MQITINLSRANVPLPKMAEIAGKATSLLHDPTVTVCLEIQAGKRRLQEIMSICKELKIPFTTYVEEE